MRFELLTLGGVTFRDEAHRVNLTTAAGQLTILPSHEPLTAVVTAGPISVTLPDGDVRHYAAFGGVLEVTATGVRLLTDEAEPGEALIESEIEAALQLATDLRERAESHHEVHQARELAGKHTVRLEVARLHRRRRERTDTPSHPPRD